MPLILQQIPKQNFELVRDRIGLILSDELQNQVQNGWTTYALPNVWVERAVSIDKSSRATINVRLNSGEYGNRDYTSVDGNYLYFIDFYVTAPGDDNSDGDKLAAINLQDMMGKCRSILSNPVYATLNFAPGFIGGVTVSSIAMGAPPDDADAKNLSRGQLIVSVRIMENEILKSPSDLAISHTSVKLYNTSKGYVYLWDKDVNGGVFSNEFTIQFI